MTEPEYMYMDIKVMFKKYMCNINFIEIHLVVVEIFQSGPKKWPEDWHFLPENHATGFFMSFNEAKKGITLPLSWYFIRELLRTHCHKGQSETY